MTLQKRTYDSIWYVAAVISVCAVVVADGGHAWPRWLLPILLGSAVSISAYLSLYVRRSTTEGARNSNDDLVEPLCDKEVIGIQTWAEASLVTEQRDKILDIRDVFEEVVEMRSEELQIHMREEISDYLKKSEYRSVINYSRSLLKQAANE